MKRLLLASIPVLALSQLATPATARIQAHYHSVKALPTMMMRHWCPTGENGSANGTVTSERCTSDTRTDKVQQGKYDYAAAGARQDRSWRRGQALFGASDSTPGED
jgi:hypothetical protein